jgi:hypothetical protein
MQNKFRFASPVQKRMNESSAVCGHGIRAFACVFNDALHYTVGKKCITRASIPYI